MTDPRRIREALERVLDSDLTPEEACGDDVELLPEVRKRWARVRDVEASVELLFPTPTSSDDKTPCFERARWRAADALPQIPGYEVEALLGTGGMGAVYKARHLKLDRPVAIKMLFAGPCASNQELECLLREARAVAGLRHPNIVQVHDVGEFDGMPYFTMEFVEAGTLARKLDGKPQPPRAAAALISALANAMHVAHEGGVVHRDLKPANILLTADGTPKIGDFSIARNIRTDDVTLGAARGGTPSYMSPEQALGKADAFCPAVDVYALGALLYEMLTGRPPFRANSPAETEREVIANEPTPPSRLNAIVPRDLETICLKCLEKDPKRRYASAAALADELQRFLRGEPIAARAAGALERAIKWLRRNPAQAIALAATLTVVLTIVAGATWSALQRAQTGRAVTLDLGEVERHQEAADWPAARRALDRAKARLGDGGSAALRQRADQSERELDLVERLEEIHLQRGMLVDWQSNRHNSNAWADREYEAAFRAAGLMSGVAADDAAQTASRIRASKVFTALIAALDDWTACSNSAKARPRQEWLMEVARRADPDPSGWRDRARDPSVWREREAILDLAANIPDEEQSLSLLLSLAERLSTDEAQAIALLRRVQQEHSSDFWANLALGLALGERRPGEAVRYFQAAVAIRPEAVEARADLGIALALDGHVDEALEQLRHALRIDDRSALAHDAMGSTLLLKNRRDEAIEHFRTALEINPRSGPAHNNLGKAFAESGRFDEAIEQFRLALETNPDAAPWHSSLGYALFRQGRVSEALAEGREAVRLDPNLVGGRVNLALTLAAMKETDEATSHLQRAIEIDPNDADARTNYGNLLTQQGRVSEAIEHYRAALQAHPNHAGAHHGLGVIAGEAHDFDEAIAHFQAAVSADPERMVSVGALGRALMLKGRYREAAAALQRFVDSLFSEDPRREPVQAMVQECERLAEEAESAANSNAS